MTLNDSIDKFEAECLENAAYIRKVARQLAKDNYIDAIRQLGISLDTNALDIYMAGFEVGYTTASIAHRTVRQK